MTVGNAGPGSGEVGVPRVVVIDVSPEDRPEMALTEDEHAVEAFAPLGADHPLANGVSAPEPGLGS